MADTSTTEYDYVIVGAGPAGLQMAYFLEKANRRYVVLEASDKPGAFFARHPRHRTLLSINKVYNGHPEADFNLRHDWNSLLSDDESLLFKNYSKELFPGADELTRYMGDFAERFQLAIEFGKRVIEVRPRTGTRGFEVRTDDELFSCETLLIATGAISEYLPQIEGVELATTYDKHSLDPADYQNKKVAILGNGNSAFEVADHLAGSAAIIHMHTRRQVRHAWQTHYPGDLRAVNNNLLDMYQLKSLHATMGYEPKKIVRRDDGALRVHLEAPCPHWSIPGTINVEFDYDEVICCTGWRYIEPSLFADDVRPESDAQGRYPRLNAMWETSVPGMYFMGTAMAARDKRAASSFIHGFRYNVRTLFHLLEERCQGVQLPGETSEIKTKGNLLALAEEVIKRVSVSSGLYQMNGFLTDVILVSSGQARYIPEIPIELIEERRDFHEADHVFTVSLEYGFQNYSSSLQSVKFNVPSDALRNECSAFLHPVLRRWEKGKVVDEHRLGESPTTRYDTFFSPDAFAEGFGEAFGKMNLHMVANFINKHVGVIEETLSESSISQEQFGKFLRPWNPKEIEAYHSAEKERAKRDATKTCRFFP